MMMVAAGEATLTPESDRFEDADSRYEIRSIAVNNMAYQVGRIHRILTLVSLRARM